MQVDNNLQNNSSPDEIEIDKEHDDEKRISTFCNLARMLFKLDNKRPLARKIQRQKDMKVTYMLSLWKGRT